MCRVLPLPPLHQNGKEIGYCKRQGSKSISRHFWSFGSWACLGGGCGCRVANQAKPSEVALEDVDLAADEAHTIDKAQGDATTNSQRNIGQQ